MNCQEKNVELNNNVSYYQVYLYILKSLSCNFSTYTYRKNISQFYFTLLCNNQRLEWIETYKNKYAYQTYTLGLKK